MKIKTKFNLGEIVFITQNSIDGTEYKKAARIKEIHITAWKEDNNKKRSVRTSDRTVYEIEYFLGNRLGFYNEQRIDDLPF